MTTLASVMILGARGDASLGRSRIRAVGFCLLFFIDVAKDMCLSSIQCGVIRS